MAVRASTALRTDVWKAARAAPLKRLSHLNVAADTPFVPASVLDATERHVPIRARLFTPPRGVGAISPPNTHLALLLIEHGATLRSFDRDSERQCAHGDLN